MVIQIASDDEGESPFLREFEKSGVVSHDPVRRTKNVRLSLRFRQIHAHTKTCMHSPEGPKMFDSLYDSDRYMHIPKLACIRHFSLENSNYVKSNNIETTQMNVTTSTRPQHYLSVKLKDKRFSTFSLIAA